MLFKNAMVFTEAGQFVHGSFRVEDGTFTEILDYVPEEDGMDLENACVIPGLIDVHNHGNSGADFSDGDYDGLQKMAALMEKMRNDPPSEIAGDDVIRIRDYADGSIWVAGLGKVDKTPFQGSNVLYFQIKCFSVSNNCTKLINN